MFMTDGTLVNLTLSLPNSRGLSHLGDELIKLGYSLGGQFLDEESDEGDADAQEV